MNKYFILLISALLSYNICISQEVEKAKESKKREEPVYKEAFYPTGEINLAKLLNTSIKFNDDIEENIVAKDIILSFYVMPDSTLRDITLIAGTEIEDIDMQIIKFFNKIHYAPAVQNNIEIKSNVVTSLPIRLKRD